MKTLAALLFSALTFTACATDEADIDAVDKPGMDERKETDQTLGGDVGDWADQHVSGPRGQLSGMLSGPVAEWARQMVGDRHVDTGLDGRLGDWGDWAEEIIIGSKLYTLLHGHDGRVDLFNAWGDIIVTGQLSRDRGLPEK